MAKKQPTTAEKQATEYLVDQYLTTAINQFAKMKSGLVDYPAIAEELRKMRDEWRLRRRFDELQ